MKSEAVAAGADEHGASCADCGAPTCGRFCANCGQATHVHRSLGHLGEELLHGVMHFDSRLWRTLPLLIANPGKLTREWVHGRRTRYVSPLATFLFTVFVLFMLLSFWPAPAPEVSVRRGAESSVVEGGRIPAGQADDFAVDTGHPKFDAKVSKKLKNPEFAIYKLQQTFYKFSFLLVPISIPFVALLFLWKRGTTLYDHGVFVLYSLTFMALVLTLAATVLRLGASSGWVLLALVIAAPVHMYAQLKGAYELRPAAALWRTGVLLVFSLVTLLLFVAAVLWLGLTG